MDDENVTKGKLKRKWVILAVEESNVADDEFDELLYRIQKHTGETREVVVKTIKEALANHAQKCQPEEALTGQAAHGLADPGYSRSPDGAREEIGTRVSSTLSPPTP